MNVLILGNGFDLNYHLPTKYVNFLHTVNYINSATLIDVKNVGDIFGNPKLQSIDKDINISYQAYQKEYDNIVIEKDVIYRLSKIAQDNLWFNYLFTSLNKDIGWIDFEKEISVVLKSFQSFLQNDTITFNSAKHPNSQIDRYILNKFNFFYQKTDANPLSPAECKVNGEYTSTYPYGSQIKKINKDKIIGMLETQLIELTDGLKLYLQCFVDQVVEELVKNKKIEKLLMFHGTNHVITFNYTNTYEKVYSHNSVFHIHGDVDNKIILGVNPDESDDGETIDTSFLRFKKYYQRVVHRSDAEYLQWLQKQQANATMSKVEEISLLVMGHSLDITDQDIIMELFDLADDITILYYNEEAKASLIRNLVNIFGRKGFYELRTKKKLSFLSQDSDFRDFAKKKELTSKTTLERYVETIISPLII